MITLTHMFFSDPSVISVSPISLPYYLRAQLPDVSHEELWVFSNPLSRTDLLLRSDIMLHWEHPSLVTGYKKHPGFSEVSFSTGYRGCPGGIPHHWPKEAAGLMLPLPWLLFLSDLNSHPLLMFLFSPREMTCTRIIVSGVCFRRIPTLSGSEGTQENFQSQTSKGKLPVGKESKTVKNKNVSFRAKAGKGSFISISPLNLMRVLCGRFLSPFYRKLN